MNGYNTLIGTLLLVAGSVAQETFVSTGVPSESGTGTHSVPDSIRPRSLALTRSPSSTDICTRFNDRWRHSFTEWYGNNGWRSMEVGCDDIRVSCLDFGRFDGTEPVYASEYCCKCKVECGGQCNEPILTPWSTDSYVDDYNLNFAEENGSDQSVADSSFPIFIAILGCICFVVFVIKWEQKNNLQDTEQTMAARRQEQQTGGNAQGERNSNLQATQQTIAARRQEQQTGGDAQVLSEEEMSHARYELFVTKFYFQTVLPDKSNITAESLRNSSICGKKDEELPAEESSKTETNDNNHNDSVPLGIDKDKETGPTEETLSERVSSWRKPTAKDECCICLECYVVGETICAPIRRECKHVFHEGCINEWLKKNDKCPLCRVELVSEK